MAPLGRIDESSSIVSVHQCQSQIEPLGAEVADDHAVGHRLAGEATVDLATDGVDAPENVADAGNQYSSWD